MSEIAETPPTPGKLRQSCQRAALAFAIACFVLTALILLDGFGPWLVHHPDGGQVAAKLIGLVAPAAYMTGLWRLGRALKSFAETGRFAAAVSNSLASVGWALLAGGVFQTALAPGLEALAHHGPGYLIGLDAAALVLAALGVALLIFARLFKRAGRMEAELDLIL